MKDWGTLMWRKIDQKKMTEATNRVIDLLRKELKLEPYECYFVIQTLYKEFPLDTLER